MHGISLPGELPPDSRHLVEEYSPRCGVGTLPVEPPGMFAGGNLDLERCFFVYLDTQKKQKKQNKQKKQKKTKKTKKQQKQQKKQK